MRQPPIPLLNGASNFLDLGGLSGLDDRRVRTGKILRSDQLARLTADDHRAPLPLAITHSIDFRGESERTALPSVLPGKAAIPLAIEPTLVVQALLVRGKIPTETEAEAVELMCQTYRRFALDSAPSTRVSYSTCWPIPHP